MAVEPFRVRVDGPVLDDLHDRLRGARWPDVVAGTGWEQGMDTEVLRSFVRTWLEDFDWREQEARFEAHEQVRVEVDGTGVHALVARAMAADALPLLVLHGWPSSVVQVLPVLPALTSPQEHGGGAGDAFHVVAPSLPGFGWSDRPTRPGTDTARIADLLVDVMDQLGHRRFVARGSDLGAGVLQQMALRHPERLVALHLSGTNPWLGPLPDDLAPEEEEFVAAARRWSQTEMAYAMEHSTKPQTLAHALNDSPVGLASWVLEKFRTWSDCDGDLDSVYDRGDLLANLTVYWVTQTIGSSMRLYWETARSTTASRGRVGTPTGMAMSGRDMFPTPRAWAERSYDVVSWTDLPRGGHFLEWEVPDLLAADLRAFARPYR